MKKKIITKTFTARKPKRVSTSAKLDDIITRLTRIEDAVAPPIPPEPLPTPEPEVPA